MPGLARRSTGSGSRPHPTGCSAAADELDDLAEQILRTPAPPKPLSPYPEGGFRAGGAERRT